MTVNAVIMDRLEQTKYNSDELDAIGEGTFFYPDSPRLPSTWWRGFDSIENVVRGDGGGMEARWRVKKDLPLFEMHFPGQPVLPGVFGLDQVQMMAGAMLAGMGFRGQGLAKGGDRYGFQNMITPDSDEVLYRIENVRILDSKFRAKIFADGKWFVDRRPCGHVTNIQVQVLYAQA